MLDLETAAAVAFICRHPRTPSCLTCCHWSCFRAYKQNFRRATVSNLLYKYGFLTYMLLSVADNASSCLQLTQWFQKNMRNVQQWQINLCWKCTWPAYQVAVGEKRGPGYHRNGQFPEWHNFAWVTSRLTLPQVPKKDCCVRFKRFQKILKIQHSYMNVNCSFGHNYVLI